MINTRSTKEVVVIFFFWMVLITMIVSAGLKIAGLDFSPGNNPSASSSGNEESLDSQIARYQEILNDNPNNLQALTGLGDIYFDNQRYQQAIEIFTKAEKISPASVHIENDLGLLFLNTGNNNMAIEKFRKVLELDSSHLASMYYMGIAYNYKGNTDKALQIYNELLTLNPPPELARTVNEEISKIKSDAIFK